MRSLNSMMLFCGFAGFFGVGADDIGVGRGGNDALDLHRVRVWSVNDAFINFDGA